ncbi:MAG: Hydroxymethylpyrimidine ABC transporter, transmembrane component [Pseudolabrys sp.]|jgi:NitT/TauT family transport system permease protein|nr:Hydroxymethylpyrimidine ABC transporter, transmembrane component [Pseudolabrys sp.]
MKNTLARIAGQIGVFFAFFALWELAVDLLHVKPVILPPPSMIFVSMVKHWLYLLQNSWPTFLAVSFGFGIAAVLGFVIAIGIAYSRWVSELTYPFLIAAQVIPKVALAPLFLIWFGFGLAPKVVIAALIAFFPIVINTARGLMSVEPELIQYMRSLGANWREIFFKISLPWALPYIFASFRISITLAVVGAVVGEFVSSDTGLGYVISYANTSLDTDVMFAGIFVLSVLGMLLFLVVVLIERLFLSWQAAVEGTPETM